MAELPKGEIAWLIEQFNIVKNMALTFGEAIEAKTASFDEHDYAYLFNEYSAAKKRFEVLKGNLPFCLKEISFIPERTDAYGFRRNLYTMAMESRKAIAYLSEIKPPLISKESKSELKSLREEIEKISGKLEPYIEQNYIFAIDSFEDGHVLGASLIASRLIEYYLDKLNGENINEKIQSLRLKMRSDKKRQNVSDSEQSLIRSSKSARNILSHNIHAIPEPEESLSLLSNCISLIKMMME